MTDRRARKRIKALSKQAKNYIKQVYSALAGSPLVPNPLRPFLLRMAGVKIGKHAHITPLSVFKFGKITIGSHFACGVGIYVDGSGEVVIGDRVGIAAYAKIMTSTHSIMPSVYRRDRGETILRTTTIGNGVWLGLGVMVLPGVTVGDGCVIAAGSVVTKDCAPNGLYAGSPARRIKDLPVETDRPFHCGKII